MFNRFMKRGEEQQLWALAGPLMAACMLLIVLFRSGADLIGLPFLALLGMVLCHFWKWQGMAASSVLTLVLSSYYLYSEPKAQSAWVVVLSLCIVSIFIVTVLCFDEFTSRWLKLHKAAHDSHATIGHLNEQLLVDRKRLSEAREEFQSSIQLLKDDLSSKDGKILSNERQVSLAQEELSSAYQRQEKMLRELSNARVERATLAVTVEELTERLAKGSNHERVEQLEAELATLHDKEKQIVEMESALFSTKGTLGHLENDLAALKEKYEAIKEIEATLNVAEAKIKEYESEVGSLKQTVQLHEGVVEEFNEYVGRLVVEKNHIEQEVNLVKEREKANLERESAALQHYSELEKQSAHESRQMQSACAKLMADNDTIAQEVKRLQEELTKEKAIDPVEIKDRDVRRLEGLYAQLRQQFNEKSDLLVATRRELFETQENLTALQNEQEEWVLSHAREVDVSLQKLLEEAEKELKISEEEHVVEIAHLHEVIDSLMACEKGA